MRRGGGRKSSSTPASVSRKNPHCRGTGDHTTSSFFRRMRRIKFSIQSCSSPEP